MDGDPPSPPYPSEEPTEQRVAALLEVARLHGTGVALDELATLLPDGAPRRPSELEAWLRSRTPPTPVVDGIAFSSQLQPAEAARRARKDRGRGYLEQAHRLTREELAPIHRWVLCLCVTGSTAFGEPMEGDDLDLLLVTRRGSLWWVLAVAYLRIRLASVRGRSRAAPACLNLVLDEPAARAAFAEPKGLLFAREALSARPMLGEAEYRELLAHGRWMRSELPRLYDRWQLPDTSGPSKDLTVPTGVRLLSALAFLPVAAYLQLQGLVRNARFRRQARPERQFRTVTAWGRMAFLSDRYEELRRQYGVPSWTAPASE